MSEIECATAMPPSRSSSALDSSDGSYTTSEYSSTDGSSMTSGSTETSGTGSSWLTTSQSGTNTSSKGSKFSLSTAMTPSISTGNIVAGSVKTASRWSMCTAMMPSLSGSRTSSGSSYLTSTEESSDTSASGTTTGTSMGDNVSKTFSVKSAEGGTMAQTMTECSSAPLHSLDASNHAQVHSMKTEFTQDEMVDVSLGDLDIAVQKPVDKFQEIREFLQNAENYNSSTSTAEVVTAQMPGSDSYDTSAMSTAIINDDETHGKCRGRCNIM